MKSSSIPSMMVIHKHVFTLRIHSLLSLMIFQWELVNKKNSLICNVMKVNFFGQLLVKCKCLLSGTSEKCNSQLLIFPTTWECEQGFSTFLTIKSKTRNRLVNPEHDFRCSVSKILYIHGLQN